MISIVIPIYNLADYLAACLDSCLHQTYQAIEVLCVNDGSTDSSAQIVEDYVRRDARFILINQENSGVVMARNAGINHSRGEYLYFLDGDDCLPPMALEALMQRMLASQADVVRGNYQSVDEDGKLLANEDSHAISLTKGSEFFSFLCQTGAGAIWNHLIKKELFIHSVTIPSHLAVGEDLYALLQLSRKMDIMACVDTVTYFYRLRGTSVMNREYMPDSAETISFLNKNMALCHELMKYARKHPDLSKYEKHEIEILVCDKMTTFILPLTVSFAKNPSVFALYKECFLFNYQVQRSIIRRSWGCYLSILFQCFKLI